MKEYIVSMFEHRFYMEDCIVIRSLRQEDDRGAISNIYERSWKYAYDDIIPKDYLDRIPKGQWVTSIDSPQRNTLLVIEKDSFIGTSSYCKSRRTDMDGYGEIISIYLLPEYMGRGYGKKLLQETVHSLADLGFKDIFLWVLEENKRARKFYEKFGFQPSEVYLEDVIGGRKLREVQYRYHVNEPTKEVLPL